MRTHGKPATYGHGCRCEPCTIAAAEWRRENRLQNLERKKAQTRASYHRHRDRRVEEKFIAAYGITWAERDALAAEQGNRCAICDSEVPLELDHCHEGGHVRGMLCGKCNKGIGLMSDDPARLRAAASYLEGARLVA